MLISVSSRTRSKVERADRLEPTLAVAVCRSRVSLGLVEQAHVLQRDQRLARERARKRDLPVRIRPNLVAIEGENAHDLPAVDERHDKNRPGSVDLDAADDQGTPFW